jgi:cysteine desulfurase
MSSTRIVYMDYNATAPMRDEAIAAYQRAAAECPGNASSTHASGRAARTALDDARCTMAAAMGARPREVVFTSGGTEADNLAVKGVALARGGGHIVTSAVEHPAVLEVCRWLETRGFRVTYVGVDDGGRVAADQVAAAVTDDTILVSIMWVNNETGVIQPVEEIAAMTREKGVPFHSDAVQAFGRVPIDLAAVPVDLLSISAHKFGGPKGAGALVVRSGVDFEPLIHGGGQEGNRRSGTYNLPAAAAMATAARLAVEELGDEGTRLAALRDRLEAGARERLDDVHVNGAGAPRVANTANIRFDGAFGESVLIGLDAAGVAASSASACAASRNTPSYVLMAMGLSRKQAEDSMRFSLGRRSSDADVDRLLEVLPAVVGHTRAAL